MVRSYFADAPDVPAPCSQEQWEGAIRLTSKCLGLRRNPYSDRIAHIIMPVDALMAGQTSPGQKPVE
jgi:hypothetical protein